MHGPNSAAGVKILVHDQKEIPLVRELGQAISPGSHAFVGIQLLQVRSTLCVKSLETLDYLHLITVIRCKMLFAFPFGIGVNQLYFTVIVR